MTATLTMATYLVGRGSSEREPTAADDAEAGQVLPTQTIPTQPIVNKLGEALLASLSNKNANSIT